MKPGGRRDPFEVLGVGVSATVDEVKAAYRRKVKDVHPNAPGAGGGDRTLFQEVHEAYRSLLDPSLREEAERFRATRIRSEVQDAFDRVFDGFDRDVRGHPVRRRRGADVERRLVIGVGEAMAGGRHVLSHASGPCSVCGGGGRLRVQARSTCPDCLGRGLVRRTVGLVTSSEVCPTCNGRGEANVAPCGFCAGVGNVRGAGVDVDLPPGTRSGTKVVVEGAGAPGTGGGRPGDLVVEVEVSVPAEFRERGDDVEIAVAVDVWDAALGATVEVPTVGGGVVGVPMAPGTQPGTRIVVENEGLPVVGGRRGRMTVVLEVVVPDASVEPYRTIFAAMRSAAT